MWNCSVFEPGGRLRFRKSFLDNPWLDNGYGGRAMFAGLGFLHHCPKILRNQSDKGEEKK